MRRSWLVAWMVGVSMGVGGFATEAAAGVDDGIAWLGHASFRIERAKKVVYIDPWRIAGDPQDADVVLLTHPHFDHLSAPDIEKVSKAGTVTVGPKECLEDLTGVQRVVKPGDTVELEGMTVEAVPAYNTNKAYHPKDKQWVGFILTIGKTRVYHAGDTDVIPEMRELKADVALLPVSGTYVMTAEEAAMAANLIGSKLAIPMHYGSIVGTEADAQRFKTRCEPVPVKIFSRESARHSPSDSCCRPS